MEHRTARLMTPMPASDARFVQEGLLYAGRIKGGEGHGLGQLPTRNLGRYFMGNLTRNSIMTLS